MATIYREETVNASVEKLWDALRDVGSIDGLLSYLDGAEVDGDYRSCSLDNGATIRELIITVDDERRRIAYSIVEEPFGFDHHSASMRVVEKGDQALFVWETDVMPNSVVEALEPIIDLSINDIRTAVEAA